MKNKKIRINVFVYTILSIFSLVIIVPLIWVLGNALKSDMDSKQNMASLIPSAGQWQFNNFVEAWVRGGIGTTFKNSIIITFASVFLILLVSYMTSYALSRIPFKGRELLLAGFISMIMVPMSQVIMIPQYRLMSSLGLINSYAGIILLYLNGGIAFSIFLLTSFLRKIPVEIDEAATIDGCNHVQIIFKILLPLSKPALATVIIFQSINIWNDYFTPLIYLHDPELKTITLGLKNFMGMWGLVEYNKLFAAISIITFPIVLIYVIFQKQFISGLTSGSVKS